MSKTPYLMDETPLFVYPTLAVMLGINKALIFQTLHNLLSNQKAAKNQYNLIDDRWWVYNSYAQWKENYFPWLGTSTIKRLFNELEADGFVKSRQSVKNKSDRRKWYTIDYEKWREFTAANVPNRADATAQNEPMVGSKRADGSTAQNEPMVGSKRADGYSIDSSEESTKDSSKEGRAGAPDPAVVVSPAMAFAIDEAANRTFQPIDQDTAAQMQAQQLIEAFETAYKARGAPQTIRRTRENRRIAAQWYRDGYSVEEIAAAVSKSFDDGKPAAFTFLAERLAAGRLNGSDSHASPPARTPSRNDEAAAQAFREIVFARQKEQEREREKNANHSPTSGH